MVEQVQQRSGKGWIYVLVGGIVVVIVLIVGLLFFRPTVVPDLDLLTGDQADAALQEAGLEIGSRGEVTTDAVGGGLVFMQDPAEGSTVPRNSSVDVTYAVEPVEVAVPDVIGLDAASASATLQDARFIVWTVDVFDTSAGEGTVIKQLPGSETAYLTGQPVVIAVAAGPNDGTGVAVPSVIGKTFEQAVAAIKDAGLSPEAWIVNPLSTSVVVTEQMPLAEVVVRPGTTVVIRAEEQ